LKPAPKPLSDLQVKRLKPGRKKESQHLDFKREWWHGGRGEAPGEEAAKDVAALANAEGGDIIVGAAERPGGAFDSFHEWNKPTSPHYKKEPVEEVLKLVSPYLRPRDFVESIRARLVEPHGAPCPLLVITIPKSAFLVGCADGSGHEAKVRYPIRTETRTDFIEPGEVLRRARDNDPWKRFRFRNLLKRGLPIKLFGEMMMQFRTEGGPDYVTAIGGASVATWHVVSIEDDAVTLQSEYVRDHCVLPHDKHYRYAPIPESTLSIPYELIRTIWVSSIMTMETAHVMLDNSVGLMWDYPLWALYLRNADQTAIEEDHVHWTDAPDNPNESMIVGPDGTPCTRHPFDPAERVRLRMPRPRVRKKGEGPRTESVEWTEEEGPI
jgi:hypothetical protein